MNASHETGYHGHVAFSYLDPAERPSWELAPQRGRVPEYDLDLSDEERTHAERLLRDALVISLHDHPHVYPIDPADIPMYTSAGRVAFAYEGLAGSGLDVVFDNLSGPTARIESRLGWTWEDVLHDALMTMCDLSKQDGICIVKSVDDVHEARANGRLGVVLGIEAATCLGSDVDRVDLLYGLGLRQMGLVYNEANMLGGGLKEFRDGGLTRFGRRVVRRMNQLGMLVDLSHAGDRTTLDAIHASEAPVVISHAGARSVWPTERMKPDHVLRELADAGGLIGVQSAPNTTMSTAHPKHSIESVMDHFEHCVEVMGIDHVTFGPDTLFGDHVGLHHAFSGIFQGTRSAEFTETDSESRAGVVEDLQFEEVAYCAGMENPAENFRNVISWLVKHGYSDDDIAKVVGGNTLRVLDESW